MKKKIRLIDKINDKIIEKEYTERNIFHFITSQKHHPQIFRDKTKYTRKEKYKKDYI